MFKSADGGASWVPANVGLTKTDAEGRTDTQVSALAADPTAPGLAYVDTNTGGLWKTTDGGESWSRAGLANVRVQSLVVDPAAPDTLYAGSHDRGVFKTTSGGRI